MRKQLVDRRTVLTATTALTAASLLPRTAFAQPAPASLPARGEFVVRGAHVLSMDDKIGDFAAGDVHVRDGAIVAVAAGLNAPGAQTLDGKGMICMPGFVDTHWHHWTSFLRPVMRTDDPKTDLFPGHRRARPALYAGRQLQQRAAEPGRSADRRRHHHPQLGAQCAQSGARRRRGARDARERAARPLRLRPRAWHAERQADGPRRHGAPEARRRQGYHAHGSACARAMSTATMPRAAPSTPPWRPKSGAARARSVCRSRYTPMAAPRSSCSTAPICSARTCSSSTRSNLAEKDFDTLAKHGAHYSVSPLGEAGRSGEMQFAELMQAGVHGEPLDRQRHRRALRLLCLHAHDADRQQAP